MDSNIPIIGQKKRACGTCGKVHPFAKCRYEDLISRIGKLSAANQAIPSLFEANKELTTLANTFRVMAKDSAMALLICEKAVMEFDNGPNVWARFQERLEKEWPQTSSQGTGETQDLSSQESTTPNETGSKLSTETILTGDPTAQDSSQLTNAAMRVGSQPPLLTI